MLNQRGFNLIELMIAIAIITTGAVVAIPSFTNMMGNAHTRTLAESFVSGLQIARLEAVKRNQSVKFEIDNSDYSWEVGCVNVDPDSCPAVISSNKNNESYNPNIDVNVTGNLEATFTSLGTLSAVAGQLSQVDITNTNIPVANAKKLRVTLGVGGNARMCDQEVTDPTDTRAC